MLKFHPNRSIFKEVRNSIGGGNIFWGTFLEKWGPELDSEGRFDLHINFHHDRSIFEKVLKFHYGGFHGVEIEPLKP